MKIKLTKTEEKFLKEFATKQYPEAKDNLLTHEPIHVVERRKGIVVGPDYDYDNIEYTINGGYDYYESFEAVKNSLIDHYNWEGAELHKEVFKHWSSIDEINDAADVNDLDIFVEEHCIKYIWVPVAFFLIRDEAVRYTQYQRHNLGYCRIYTYGLGYSNDGDFPVFRNLLMKMGMQLLENVNQNEE